MKQPGAIVKTGGGDFGGGGVSLQYYRPWIVIDNGDSIAHTLTFQINTLPRAVPLTVSTSIGIGQTSSFPTLPFVSVAIDTPSTSVVYFYSNEAIWGLNVTASSVITSLSRTNPGVLFSGTRTVAQMAAGVLGTVPANTIWHVTGVYVDMKGPLLGSTITMARLFVQPQGITVKRVLLDDEVGVAIGNNEVYSMSVLPATATVPDAKVAVQAMLGSELDLGPGDVLGLVATVTATLGVVFVFNGWAEPY